MKGIRQIYTIIILTLAWSNTALFGESFPQTNMLVAEIKIPPPTITAGAQFGDFVAAKSNVFVASFKNAPRLGTTPVAAVFKSPAPALRNRQHCPFPRNRIFLSGTSPPTAHKSPCCASKVILLPSTRSMESFRPSNERRVDLRRSKTLRR